jgi:hypothetical protein
MPNSPFFFLSPSETVDTFWDKFDFEFDWFFCKVNALPFFAYADGFSTDLAVLSSCCSAGVNFIIENTIFKRASLLASVIGVFYKYYIKVTLTCSITWPSSSSSEPSTSFDSSALLGFFEASDLASCCWSSAMLSFAYSSFCLSEICCDWFIPSTTSPNPSSSFSSRMYCSLLTRALLFRFFSASSFVVCGISRSFENSSVKFLAGSI